MSTLTTVTRIVAQELDLPLQDLDPTRPLSELGVDSLMMIEAMFRLENEFGIEMPGGQVPIHTVQDIADLVDRLLAEQDSTKSPEPGREEVRPWVR